MMKEFSVLIGGKAGFGIDTASLLIARIINRLGWRIYVYRDYPSLIRGGHTFSIIRASEENIAVHNDRVDFLLALNQDTVDLHKHRLKNNSILIYDNEAVKSDSLPGDGNSISIALDKILKEENASEIMRNSCIIGSMCRVMGIEWEVLKEVFQKNIAKETELNLAVALRGYNAVKELISIKRLSKEPLPLVTGNEAVGLGLVKAGLKDYVSYPMTPTSGILHFLASAADDFGLRVIHPENEIAVVLMALGFSYAGDKVAVGTSGGGFCLMTEGLSFSGMAELPVVFIVGQRPGPSTGLPTYSSQTELFFALNAGHGEFSRLVVAPGNAEEAYFWSAVSLNLSRKYQIPSLILLDKTLSEGTYDFDLSSIEEIAEEKPLLWDRVETYKRYLNTETGVSPLAFVPEKEAVIKVNSYEHDEAGITTESSQETKKMQDKRLIKEKYLIRDLAGYKTVSIEGDPSSTMALVCWGSNKGVCSETGRKLGLRVIQPAVLAPLPLKQLKKSIRGVKRIICVENNATAQFARLIESYGIKVNDRILKYDGRPFSPDELESRLNEILK